jgi:hypothetical protein
MRRLVPFSAALLGAYIALAVAAFCTAWRDPAGRWVGNDFDTILYIWHLRWLPFALGDGHNPLISNYMDYPAGFNLMWNTSILLPAFVLSPVTLLLGVVVAYNVLATLALALSAWCAFFAFRRYVRPVPAAVGGLLYGFSPYMFAQAQNHPHMTLAVFPPVALLLLDEALVRQRRPPLAIGALIAVAAVLQLFTGEEILAATVLVAAIGVVLLAVLRRDQIRPRAPYALRALGSAAAIALVLAAVPLGVQLFGSQHVAVTSGPVQGKGAYVLDAAELVVPTQRQELTFNAANDLGEKYGGQTEIDGYVGIPLLVLAAFVVVRWRRLRVVQFAAALAVATTLLAFGPRLTVAGRTLPIPLPWVIPQRVPFLENILPARLTLFVFLLLALLVAIFVDRVRLPRPAIAAVVAVALVPLLPNLPYQSSAEATPSFFTSGARAIPKGSVALIAPLAGVAGGTTVPLLWQAKAAMRFRMPEGYVIHPRSSYAVPQSDRAFFDRMTGLGRGELLPPLTDSERRNARCTLLHFAVGTVVVGPMHPGRQQTIAFFRDVLGRAPIHAGGVAYWPDVSGVSRCA